MQFPTWLKPGLTGAVLGAIVLAVFGFGWGGWVTGGTAKDLAAKASTAAVAVALTPYCVDRATGTDGVATLTELKAATSYNRKGIVEKSGWATPLGAEKPSSELAQACQLKLAEAF
jgi:hypothetical protein